MSGTKEEEIINNLLWHYYTDEQNLAIERQIVSSQTAESTAIVWKWMLCGLSNHETTNWLRVVEKNAPEFVFNNLFVLTEKELAAARFRKVMEGLTKGVRLT